MTNIETIACDLATLRISRCVGVNKNPAACPNRVVAKERAGSKICRHCDDARTRILGFVAERVISLIAGRYGSLNEDIVAEVVLDYARRLEDGRLMRAWEPGQPAWAIASETFLRLRIADALRRYRKFTRVECTLTNLDINIEAIDTVHYEAAPSDHDEPVLDSLPVLRQNLHPENWTGTAIELVAAVQLFPLFSDAIAANKRLIKKLTSAFGADPISFLERYHSAKAAEREEAINELAEAVESSVKPETAESHRDEIEQVRERGFLTPLAAPDLKQLLHLTQATANKRMTRYREFLATRLLKPSAPRQERPACCSRAGPGETDSAADAAMGSRSSKDYFTQINRRSLSMNRSSMWSPSEYAIRRVRFTIRGNISGNDARMRFCFSFGNDGLYLQIPDSGNAVSGVRFGGFPAIRTSQNDGTWRFVQPLTRRAANQFAAGDLVVSLRDGSRVRVPRPLSMSAPTPSSARPRSLHR